MEELTNSLTSPSISSSSFSEHNIIALENGDVYSFGDNDHGQCSNGTNNNVLTPTKIMNNKNIKSIVLGVYHSFYLEKNGDLYGCGYNKNSELGISNNTTDRNKFVFVTSNVVKVSASYLFTVIQKDNGKLFFTGRGMNKFSKGFTEIVGIEDIISFSCGENNVIFLKRGEVWVMGNNEFGQCGFNKSVKNIQKPTLLMKDQNIFDICCGYQHSFILTRDEKGNTLLKCFGNNSFGSLGLNDRKEKIFGVQTISQFPNIRSVHCGANHSFILTEQGDVYSCGNNAYGQLSLGDNSNRLIFSKTSLSNIILIATGWNHSIFLDDERKVFVCGRGYYGSVGLGDTKDRKVATKLDLKDKPKLFHNSGLVCLSSDYIEVKFSFIMEIEGEEEITKKQVFRNIKKSQLIGTMIQQVLLENNYFGIEKFDLKIMVPQIIQINNKNFDLNKINENYSEWKEIENKIKLIYSLSNTKFDKENSTFTNFISRKDLSETQKDLFISQLEYYVYDLKNQISNLKNEILKKDVTLSQKDLLVSQSEKEKTEKQEKLDDLRKIICKEKQKINSISSFQIEYTQKDYCFVEPLREIFVCGVCKELMENAQICSECKKNCCKKCCENEKFCPFGCEKEEMDDYPGLQKKISNLIVKCFCCEKQFKLNEIEEHSTIAKVSCRWKHVGCEFSETKNLVLLHEIECEFFLEEQKKQKLKYFESIPLFFQQITQILDK